ncbi:MAG: exodeoxyribonuclease VII large subunit [Chloroflexi bacterium]|nr:exodeoxyribonuclease VII large subunit [Chloroflexota bacterium]
MPPEVYPVRQVTRYLRELIEQNRHLSGIWVAGEVRNLTQASSGHIYFTLGDEQARAGLRCAFFRQRNIGQRERIAEGVSVVVYGSLSVYEQRGELSFIVDFVQPEGTGAQAAEFERLRALFEADGLLAPERKRPLPLYPRRIGVVTSAAGAVLHDVLDVLGRRWPLAEVIVQPTQVQGEGAGALIAEALRALGERAPAERRPDVIILARGGGAAEDLQAFNEEPVGRAIFASPVPVVSAVGHETDVTLADLVADLRAPTPSAAAELVAPDRIEVAHRIDSISRRGEARLARLLREAHERTVRQSAALDAALPDLVEWRRAIDWHEAAAASALGDRIGIARERTAAIAGRLAALSPRATLERGYAIVERADGTLATSAAALQRGEAVALRLRDGLRAARIED